MVKKTLNKSEFAALAGVSAAAVTKACKAGLQPALSGKRIDIDHPAAVEYLEKQDRAKTPEAAPGIDPMYEEAVRTCQESGRYTISGLQRALRIGFRRASKIFQIMQGAGVVPNKPTAAPPIPIEKPEDRPTPVLPPRKASGQEAQRTTKKQEALAALAPADDLATGDIIHEVPEDIQAFADMTLRELIQRFGTDTAFCDWLKATKDIEHINEKRLKNAATKGELVSRHLIKIGIIDPIDSAHIKLLTDGAKTIARRATAMHGAGRPLEDVEEFVKDQITSFIRPIKAKVARTLKNA